jgi:polyferredoxin
VAPDSSARYLKISRKDESGGNNCKRRSFGKIKAIEMCEMERVLEEKESLLCYRYLDLCTSQVDFCVQFKHIMLL